MVLWLTKYILLLNGAIIYYERFFYNETSNTNLALSQDKPNLDGLIFWWEEVIQVKSRGWQVATQTQASVEHILHWSLLKQKKMIELSGPKLWQLEHMLQKLLETNTWSTNSKLNRKQVLRYVTSTKLLLCYFTLGKRFTCQRPFLLIEQ